MTALTKIEWATAYSYAGKIPRDAMWVIHRRANATSLIAYPSQQEMAEATGLTVRSISRQLEANLNAGWIEKIRKGCTGRSTEYRLSIPDDFDYSKIPDYNYRTNTSGTEPTSYQTNMSDAIGESTTTRHFCQSVPDTSVTPIDNGINNNIDNTEEDVNVLYGGSGFPSEPKSDEEAAFGEAAIQRSEEKVVILPKEITDLPFGDLISSDETTREGVTTPMNPRSSFDPVYSDEPPW